MQCSHCGREVRETTHTQHGYKVDYYLLHTGRTEWAVLKSPQEDAPVLRYLKLIDPTDVITCVTCYAQPDVQRRLADDFHNVRSILGLEDNEEYEEVINAGVHKP